MAWNLGSLSLNYILKKTVIKEISLGRKAYPSLLTCRECHKSAGPLGNPTLIRLSHSRAVNCTSVRSSFSVSKPFNSPISSVLPNSLQCCRDFSSGEQVRRYSTFNRRYNDWHRSTCNYSNGPQQKQQEKGRAAMYATALAITMVGATYCCVPLYRMFCKVTGTGTSATLTQDSSDRIEHLEPVKDRTITVRFTANRGSNMQWNFKPQQKTIKVAPGETALAFYSAENPTDRPIIGISTYTVVPFDAGPYFNKIQCFCFEEQRLNPHEQVDMPVFFYIDPEYADDPRLERVNDIVLSYTFFEAKEGMTLPLPGYAKPHSQQG